MEIVALGSQLVECIRIARMIEKHGETFLLRAYTATELRWCRERRQTTEAFAMLWAAKEATLQTLGLRLPKGRILTDVEVATETGSAIAVLGPLRDRAESLNIARFLLTMSAVRLYATATVIAVR